MKENITGHTLIEMGFKPASWFGQALAYANREGLSGLALEKYLKQTEEANRIDYIEPHAESVTYSRNIRAEQEDERLNVESVFATMDELMKTPTMIKGAVMPDACPTGEIGQIPVGGVAVAKNAIHPAMHSADICCSVMMTSFGKMDPLRVMNAAHRHTHFGPGGRAEYSELPNWLVDRMKSNPFLSDERSLQLARHHMGTQGDGNHFLFIGISEQTGDTVMVTHHGSRGFGANLYKKGMKAAEEFRKKHSPSTMKKNAWLPYGEKVGQDYWDALQIVRDWTKLNHETIHGTALTETGADVAMRFWNEHNFVFKDGDEFYHGKGATPLDDKFVPDSYQGLRLVPLNMAQPVLVVRGDTTDSNLGFAPHGAGRNLSRSEHKRRNADRTREKIFADETRGLDVRFFSGQIDISELPSAYKDAQAVQAQMQEFGLGTVVDRILPYGCIMAGDWEVNAPWKS